VNWIDVLGKNFGAAIFTINYQLIMKTVVYKNIVHLHFVRPVTDFRRVACLFYLKLVGAGEHLHSN